MLKIITPRLQLVEVEKEDLEIIHELHSVPEVDEFNTLGIPSDISVTKKLLDDILIGRNDEIRKSYTWKIILKESNRFIGLCGMFLTADRFNSGEFYYKFYPEFWGNGYATETAKAMINTGFTNLKLHRIEAGVATQNLASIRVLEKCGMKREGLHRKILPIRGEWKDNYHYAIVEDDEI